MPKVSVIIPVYNTEKYLDECLDSVINQTLKDIEIICINDGSTDNSLEILKKYKQKDSRIITIDQLFPRVTVPNTDIMKGTVRMIIISPPDTIIDTNCQRFAL